MTTKKGYQPQINLMNMLDIKKGNTNFNDESKLHLKDEPINKRRLSRQDSQSNQSRLDDSKNILVNRNENELLLNKPNNFRQSQSLKSSNIELDHNRNNNDVIPKNIIELQSMNNDSKKDLNKSKSIKSYIEDEEEKKNETSQNSRKLVKREKICDSDTEDEGTDNEKEVRFVILPDNYFKKKWDLLIAVILIYTAIVLPFRVSFIDEDSDFYKRLDIFFDVVFGVDVVFNFFSAYIDNEDNIIKNRHVGFLFRK